jgi:hypothetical protein
MTLKGFLKYQYQKLLRKKYYQLTQWNIFDYPKFIDYFIEYDQWLKDLMKFMPSILYILDIGSDYGSMYYYLKNVLHKEIAKYIPYDYCIFKPFTRNDIDEFFNDYNFIKIDCEGCEYEIFKYVDIDRLKRKPIVIAIHYNEYYDEKIANLIKDNFPYFILNMGFEYIYTNIMNGRVIVK